LIVRDVISYEEIYGMLQLFMTLILEMECLI